MGSVTQLLEQCVWACDGACCPSPRQHLLEGTLRESLKHLPVQLATLLILQRFTLVDTCMYSLNTYMRVPTWFQDINPHGLTHQSDLKSSMLNYIPPDCKIL
jgi:hypothetical protein